MQVFISRDNIREVNFCETTTRGITTFLPERKLFPTFALNFALELSKMRRRSFSTVGKLSLRYKL